MPTKFCQTWKALADELDITREYLSRRYVNRPNAPKRTKRGHNVAKWQEFIAADRRRAVAGDGSLRDRKLLAEAEILEAKRDEILRRLVPVEHFRDQMILMQNCCLSLWESAITAISNKRRDAGLLDELNDAMNNARQAVLDLWASDKFNDNNKERFEHDDDEPAD